MPLDFEALSNWDFEEVRQTLTERDTILYALGLGFGEDPTDRKELAFVYEDGLKAVPSMPQQDRLHLGQGRGQGRGYLSKP
jgi:hypothetical protein